MVRGSLKRVLFEFEIYISKAYRYYIVSICLFKIRTGFLYFPKEHDLTTKKATESIPCHQFLILKPQSNGFKLSSPVKPLIISTNNLIS